MAGVKKEAEGTLMLSDEDEGFWVCGGIEEGVVGLKEDAIDGVGGEVGTVAAVAAHVLDDCIHS